MAADTARVTVVGSAKRIDVALPAGAAIVEYADRLADLCGEQSPDTLPAAWSLGAADHRVLPPSASLRESGIVDGQVLYLRDLTAGDYDEPLRLEAEEVVGAAASRTGGPRWDRPVRVAALLGFGALFLAASATAWAWLGAPSTGDAGLCFLLAGLIPAALGWALRRPGERLALPSGVPAGLALAAIPGLAAAGVFVGRGVHHPGAAAVGGAVGAALGLLVALAAAPGVATFAVLLTGLPLVALAAVLAGFGATGAQAAAVAALCGYGIVAFAPSLAGSAAAAWGRLSGDRDTELAVVRARGLLLAADLGAGAGLAAALILLGSGTNRYGLGVAGCVSVALLLRAGGCRFLFEAGPQIAVGLTGLAVLALRAPSNLDAPAWALPLAWLVPGVSVLLLALAAAWRTGPTGEVSRWNRAVTGLCAAGMVALTVGVFGVFQQLTALGRHL